jgi:hypothetical protein
MLLLLLALSAPQSDTTAFANLATRTLVERAMVRHAVGDSLVRDYQSKFRYRLTFGLGRRRWAQVPNMAAEEQEGTIQWSVPNDMRVEINGRRQQARSANMRLNSGFDQPWFIPRQLGDSVRVFGNDVPARAAIHPLSTGGPEWYRYKLIDSVRVYAPDGRELTLLAVEVMPTRPGVSLVAGRLWLDAGTADLVRFTFRFVGTGLWIDSDEEDDSASLKRANKIANRIVTMDADLEYALQDRQFWMPYRQVVSGRVELPWIGDIVVPFEARTTFDDYQVNSGKPIVWQLPPPAKIDDPDSLKTLADIRRDSARAERRARRRDPDRELPTDSLAQDNSGWWGGGRFEMHRAPADSLAAYSSWGDTLKLSDAPADDRQVLEVQSDLEKLAARLPNDITGRPGSGIAWERLGEIVRYNRVQGFVPGIGYDIAVDPFTMLRGDIRFGTSDARVVGGLTLVREAPGARWTLRGYREVRGNDPFSVAWKLGSSFNAMLTGHDDSDYHLNHGARLTREGSLGTGIELTTSIVFERETSVRREARSGLNDLFGGDGNFTPNPPVNEGNFGGASLRLDGITGNARWSLAGDVLGNADKATGRAYGLFRLPLGGRRAPTLTARAGMTTNDPLLQQAFRIGGTGTVRGWDYGSRGGQAMWAVQADWPVSGNLAQIVLFADAGQADRAANLFDSKLIAGGGVGFSLLRGLLRFDLSHPITSGGNGLRLDLTMRPLTWP